MATQAINAALGVGLSLLSAHTARVNGATTENEALAQLAPAIQQDLQELAAAISSGQISPSAAVSYVEQYDQNTYSYLQKQLGKPGTAWSAQYNGPITFVTTNPPGFPIGQGVACNKNCTVGCCIYYNSWKPAFAGIIYGLQNTKPGGSFSVSIGPMQSNKYGFPGFPAYTITVNIPATISVSSVASTVTDAANLLFGGQSQTSATSPVAPSKTLSPIVIVGGILLLGLGFFVVKEKSA